MPSAPSQPPRYVQARTTPEALVLTVTEPRLNGDAIANALRHELLAAVASVHRPRVVLDLRPVLSLSSTALRPLMALQRDIRDKGGALVLCNLSRVVAEVLNTTRLIGMGRSSSAPFQVAPDLATAVAALSADDAS